VIPLTVRELIETLEEMPSDYKVVVDGAEVSQILIRDEEYYTEDGTYSEGLIIKLY